MARKKKEQSIDELIADLPPDDCRSDIARQILEAIKRGLMWSNPHLMSLFKLAPNTLGPKARAWLPRTLQIKIGKIQQIDVVQLYERNNTSRKKAVYKELSLYLQENNLTESDKPVGVAYMIACPCGISFIGREPEHQITCEICKTQAKIKMSRDESAELKAQIAIMFDILRCRKLPERVEDKALSILARRMTIWGLPKEEIADVFKINGYAHQEI